MHKHILLVALSLVVASTPGGAARTEHAHDTIIWDAGRQMLSKARIYRPSDIVYAVVSPTADLAYKITWKDDRETTTRLFLGLRAVAGDRDAPGMPANGRLILQLRDGRAIWFSVREMHDYYTSSERITGIYLTYIYYSRHLVSLLADVRRNKEAAIRDSRIGELPVASVDVGFPAGEQISLQPSSPKGREIIAASAALVDWLDLRQAYAEVVSRDQLDLAAQSKEYVRLRLSRPLTFNISAYSKKGEPLGFPNPFAENISFHKIKCDEIVLLHQYGPGSRMALWDKLSCRYFLAWGLLTRRNQEKYQVQTYGWPGHPPEDTVYYKDPRELWRELQALAHSVGKEDGAR